MNERIFRIEAFDAAPVDAHEVGRLADLQQERDVEEAAAVDEPLILVGQRGQAFDGAKTHGRLPAQTAGE